MEERFIISGGIEPQRLLRERFNSNKLRQLPRFGGRLPWIVFCPNERIFNDVKLPSEEGSPVKLFNTTLAIWTAFQYQRE